MKIKGNAKVDFFEWIKSEYDFTEKTFNELYPMNLKESFLEEWLDSVGYYVSVGPHIGGGADVYYAKVIYRMENFIDTWCNIENKKYQPSVFYFDNRHEATQQAINKAIEIYNNR